ncbi:MAG TPA: hypothetical protein VGO52_15980 [Hyphomonadaceae bacterium]|nr:hypothetical protein [Hyphomonadaceae bacterium]
MARTDLVPAVTAVVLYKRVDGGGLRLNPWQWGFAVLAPILLMIIDIKLMGGWLMSRAPAAFWTVALTGWIPLYLSQKRWHTQVDPFLNGMLASCAAIAFIGAVSPVLIFFFGSLLDLVQGKTTFSEVGMSTLLSGIALILTWPLLFTAGAFRRQAKLRIRWRPDLRSKPGFIGMAVIPLLMLSAEITDRVWFGGVNAALHSQNADKVLDAAHELRFYPVTLMTKTDEVCSGLYAHGRETLVDPEALEANVAIAWGDRGASINTQAQKFFGNDATLVCADALSSGPF